MKEPVNLSKILADHELWLVDPAKGKRADLRHMTLINQNLRGVNLSEALLDYVRLSSCFLKCANFERASLQGADFRGSFLAESRFRGAYLRDAELIDTNLREADLQEADLRGAMLHRADLRGAMLYGAKLYEANLQAVKLDDGALEGVIWEPDEDVCPSCHHKDPYGEEDKKCQQCGVLPLRNELERLKASVPDDIKALGWKIFRHYDLGTDVHWEFIREKVVLVNEAATDAEALNNIREQIDVILTKDLDH